MHNKDFSILIPLKGRLGYTIRLLYFLDAIEFPYKVILADGGKDEGLQKFLQESNDFPNLKYEYIKYPYDATIEDFYSKMADAVSKVDTATVAVLDNDDFILLDGISKCLEILKEDPGISSSRGMINNIAVSNDVYGTLSLGNNMYTKFPDSICSSTAAGRIEEQTSHFHGNWHNITRSNHVKACWEMISEVKPKNMRFTEQLTGYLNVVWGNGNRSDFWWLLHQQGQRILTEDGFLSSHFPAQDEWIKSDYWIEDFNKMSEVVGVAISEYDNVSVEEGMGVFKEIYPRKLPDLENLLVERIKESNLVGYNEERINNLRSIVRKNKIREIQPIGIIEKPKFTHIEELSLLAQFLLFHHQNK